MKYSKNKLTYSLIYLVLSVSILASESSAANSTLLRTQNDASGKITVSVFGRTAGDKQQHFRDFAIDVPDDFVVVGGGMEGARSPQGNLMTASYPNDQLSAWLVSSKDHIAANSIRLKGYAIGLKIRGLSRDQLARFIRVNVNSSGAVQHPDISVGIPAGYLLIGGGINVRWDGSGNLATATYPETTHSWRAKSKDHKRVSKASAQVFAITIKDSIPGVGRLSVDINSNTSGSAQHPGSSVDVEPGFALVGCGAEVHWRGAGNLLWKLRPVTQGSQHGCEAASKDHIDRSPASITTYALGLRAS